MSTAAIVTITTYALITAIVAVLAAAMWAAHTFDGVSRNPADDVATARKAARAFFLSPLWPFVAILGIEQMWRAAHQPDESHTLEKPRR